MNVLPILKKIAGWLVFIAAITLLSVSPPLYFRYANGSWEGRQAFCGTGQAEAEETDLREIVLHPEYWDSQRVLVTGELSYASDRGMFHLRDETSVLPLDTSGCQGLEAFKEDEVPVFVRASVARNGDEPILVADGVRESAPGFVQTAFSAGLLGILAVWGLIAAGILWLVKRFLIFIGVMKKKPALLPEEIAAKKAGSLLLAGIFAPVLWYLNPFFGAGYTIAALIRGWRGLRSSKRTVAIVGMTLCVTGLVVMSVVSLGFGWFEKPGLNFYHLIASSIETEPTGKEPLELEPYVNDKWHFSIHPPKGWTEFTEDPKLPPNLRGPQDGTLKEEPFYPEIKFGVATLAELGVKDGAEAVKEFKKLMLKSEGYSLVSEEVWTLAGGRIEAESIEFLDTQEGYDRHVLALFVVSGGDFHIIGTDMPADRWERHGPLIRDSLRTLEVWEGTFAACLKSEGAVLYGLSDCDHCQEQKKLFTDGVERLPYVECLDDAGEYELDVCTDKRFEGYPTWEFSDGSRLVGMQDLKTLSEKTGCPLPK